MAAPAIDGCDVHASNELLVVFTAPVKNDAALQNAANFTVVPEFGGQAVTVRRVFTGNEISTEVIYLEVSNFSVGEQYIVTATNLVGVDGVGINLSANTARFIGRRTKVDNILASLPKVFDKRISSTIRTILAAISREDSLISDRVNVDFRIPE